MANFHLVTRNWIARRGIINKLIALGYKCIGDFTPARYEKEYPASRWPVVIAVDSINGESKVIDLRRFCHPLTNFCGTKVSPRQLDEMVANKKGVAKAAQTIKTDRNIVALPPAAKYDIEYVKADGKSGKYTISNPVDSNKHSITAYSFKDVRNPGSKPGLKTFNKARIRSLSRIAQIRAS